MVSFYDLADPKVIWDVSQVKDISKDGMCFTAVKQFPPSTKLGINIKTPYSDEPVYLQADVIRANQNLGTVVYEMRLHFDNPSLEVINVINLIYEDNTY